MAMKAKKKIVLGDKYNDSVSKLPQAVRKKADAIRDNLMKGKITQGMNFESLNSPLDRTFRSIRLDDTYRLILSERPESYILLWVGHHDDAYNWAKNRRLNVNRDSLELQEIKTVEVVHEIPVYQTSMTPVIPSPQLLTRSPPPIEKEPVSLKKGAPPKKGDLLKHITKEELCELLEPVSDELLERLLSYSSDDDFFEDSAILDKELGSRRVEILLDLAAGQDYETVKNTYKQSTTTASVDIDASANKKHKSSEKKKATTKGAINKATRKRKTSEKFNAAGRWLVSLETLDDQQKLIAALKPEESYIVEGCAGSGKSVLAMIKFNQLCQNGKHPVYATMMRALTDTIISEVTQTSDKGMAAAKKYVTSKTERINSLGHGKSWYYKSSCIGTCYMLPCINPNYENPLEGDNLVLDECQDLTLLNFRKIVEGGYQSICWYGDDDQQLCNGIEGEMKRISLQEILREELTRRGGAKKLYKLKWNYRISPSVAKFIDEFQKSIPGERKQLACSARGKRTDTPYLCGYPTGESEIDSMVKIIATRGWHRQNNHRTAILIGGSNQDIEKRYRYIKERLERVIGVENIDIQCRRGETSLGSNDWVTADPSAPIVVSTPLQSKGCQFDSVFIIANTFGSNNGHTLSPKDLNAIHVAMTRTGGELFVFYKGVMPPAFNQIPLNLYKASVDESVANPDDIGLFN